MCSSIFIKCRGSIGTREVRNEFFRNNSFEIQEIGIPTCAGERGPGI